MMIKGIQMEIGSKMVIMIITIMIAIIIIMIMIVMIIYYSD